MAAYRFTPQQYGPGSHDFFQKKWNLVIQRASIYPTPNRILIFMIEYDSKTDGSFNSERHIASFVNALSTSATIRRQHEVASVHLCHERAQDS